jgi:hypothetical protein
MGYYITERDEHDALYDAAAYSTTEEVWEAIYRLEESLEEASPRQAPDILDAITSLRSQLEEP